MALKILIIYALCQLQGPFLVRLFHTNSLNLIYTSGKILRADGTQKKIEGALEPDSKILFVDDVITTGHSVLSGIESLSNHSVISGVVVLVDRQQGSQDLFAHFALKIKSAIPILRIIKILNENARIDKHEYESIKEEIIEF